MGETHHWMDILNKPHIGEAIRPAEWGPSCWHFTDCLIFSYPVVPSPEDQKRMLQYFELLKELLPCYSCRKHFQRMMKEDSVERHLYSREALARWWHEKHNMVNERLGKPQWPFHKYVTEFSQHQPPTTRPNQPLMKDNARPSRGGQVNEESTCCSSKVWIMLGVVLVVAVGLGTLWTMKTNRPK